MKYPEAFVLMRRNGERARRPCMASGSYVFLAGGGRIVDDKSIRDESSANEEYACAFLANSPESDIPVEPVLCLRTANATIRLGHVLSAEDLLADDWQTPRR